MLTIKISYKNQNKTKTQQFNLENKNITDTLPNTLNWVYVRVRLKG